MREYKKLTPFKLCVLQNFPFIEEDFDALTNYELMCKIVEYLNKTIDSQNMVVTNITELNNWFNNLDVQDEINNKLDAMAQSGQLTDIIAQYLQLAGVLAYNTKNDLKNANNIVDGSICKTLGETNYNDGKGHFYKIRTITSSDVVDDENILALNISNTLIAEKIQDYFLNQTNERITNILKPQSYKQRKYLLVGDSYAVGYQGEGVQTIEGYYTKIVNRLGLNAQIVCASGYGFMGINYQNKWIDLIRNTVINNKDTFTDVFICGGMNDRGIDEEFDSNMSELFTYIKENFVNAEIHVGCVGRYREASDNDLLNMRKVNKLYKSITTKYGHKFIDNSFLILHNREWFINDNIHPNITGEEQLAFGLEQYIINNKITCFTKVDSNDDYQTDEFNSASNMTNNLVCYSYIDNETCGFLFSGSVTFTQHINISNLLDVNIGKLNKSYIMSSAYGQGLNEVVDGYVFAPNGYNGSFFVKVKVRLYNDSYNNLHIVFFTVLDNGGVIDNLEISEIAFPYGAIKTLVNSNFC